LDQGIARGIASRAASALARFFDRAKNFVHELIVAGAMALKGNYELSAEELAVLNNQATIQREYLDKFQREVTANPPREILDLGNSVITVSPAPMTPGQFTARLEQYGNAAWQAPQKSNRSAAKVGNTFTEERRVLGQPKGEHCPDCPPIAALGWQPIGTLPEIGDSDCHQLCLCHFEYRNGTGKPHVGPLKPAGPRVKRIPNAPQAKQAEPPKPEPQKVDIPAKDIPKPKPAKSDNYPPARPLPSVKELLEEAGSPFNPEDYEEA
jgi:hypothetical protein